MKYGKLRIAWSVTWGIACLLMVVLWVRSFSKSDIVIHRDVAGMGLTFGSNRGTVYVVRWHSSAGWKLSRSGSYDYRDGEWLYGFRFVPNKKTEARVPNSLLVVLTFAFAAAPWLRLRFSLRTQLIAMTLVAIVLGAIVFSIR